ncbi:acetyltransferase, GNAT family protein [Psychromonas ingrahamii 37]|uniref:Acetyltransferase, GNAT family protein n=1 Tax=Psychromonas ingrahamii (strain DSM 17664 / CCUG 51855 / 37) TaxID=357804 RepID=A1SZJ3_PSYIN|nr:GNAT family N-acetyltransferase [Psychromonas ingrahamii]ABM04908.1 acetyltransferase, GNAT family protein [Psychromonas ingrahamii 37]
MTLFAENEHLTVRQFIASDLNDFTMLVSNAKSMKYCPTGTLNRQQAEKLFTNIMTHAQRYKYCLYAIEDKKYSKVIGLVGLQECRMEYDIGPSFVYRLLPEYNDNITIPALFSQFIKNLMVSLQLSEMNAVIAKKNRLTLTLMESLHFKPISTLVCRGIDSFLYQYSPV